MAKMTMAQLRAQYGAPEGQRAEGTFTNNYYPFWNMKTGQRCVIRFLPDRDGNNSRGFMVEKVFHNLTIAGARKSVPCLSMYGDDCPICKISQEYYKAKDEVNGKKYWKKKQYIAQALIIEDPLDADKETGETHAGKVRYITLSYQIYNIIKEAFASEDDPLEGVPYDVEEGYDFIIKKTEQGQYASYATGTKFHSKQRALGEDELVVVEAGMTELKSLLPKSPGLEKVQAMLNADLNGEDYTEEKPAARSNRGSEEEVATPAPARAKPAVKPAALNEDDEPPFEPTKVTKPVAKPVAAAADEDGDVDEMLAAIRARRTASK